MFDSITVDELNRTTLWTTFAASCPDKPNADPNTMCKGNPADPTTVDSAVPAIQTVKTKPIVEHLIHPSPA